MPAGTSTDPIRRVVLGLSGGPVDDAVVHFGCQLARADRTELVGVYVLEVDWRHDLDDELEAEREAFAISLRDIAIQAQTTAAENEELRNELAAVYTSPAYRILRRVGLGARKES